MKKDQLFDLIGEIDEDILDRHRQMDLRLGRKQITKRHVARVLMIAACAVLILVLSLPLAALSHPAGRAVLRGDSNALTEYLVGIDGFAPWQDQVAEKLEQSLPRPLWELMQSTPILDVLTQSQYPVYAWSNASFSPYMSMPICLTYEVDDSQGRLSTIPQIDVRPQQYWDDAAKSVYTLKVQDNEYTLSYSHSLTQSLTHQAVHVYCLYGERGVCIAYVDVRSGECVYWETPKSVHTIEQNAVLYDTMIEQAYSMLSERVRDPEAYTLFTEYDGEYLICEYTRVFHSYYATDRITPFAIQTKSCDALTVTFDGAGNIVAYDLGYLGALRNAPTDIPTELFSVAYDHIRSYAQSYSGTSLSSRIVITPDGRLAYCSGMQYVLHRDDYRATAKYLAYLTEADGALQGYELISDGKPAGQRVRLSYHVYTPGSNYENIRSEFVFDSDGNKITEIAYYDGKEYYRVNYTYDEQGHMIGAESISEESTILTYRHEYEYGENGLLIKQISFNYKGKQTNEILFEYDEQGREIRRVDKNEVITYTYGENGSYVKRMESLNSDWVSESEFVYDQNGALILERTVQNGNDIKDQYEYDEQGRRIRRETWQNGELLAYTTLEYREGKLYRTINYNGSGKIVGIGITEYNEYNECILSDYRDVKGKLIQSESYEYGTVPQE